MNFKFKNKSNQKKYESKVLELENVINKTKIDEQYLWDKTVEKYAKKILTVNNILKMEGINENVSEKIFKDINTFLTKCSDAEFHISLVGTVKAGKSTLINALLGHEYASTQVTPETAALTKFKKASKNYVRITFYSESEWNKLWKSAQDSRANVFLEEYENLNGNTEKSKWLNKEDKIVYCDSNEILIKEIEKWTSSKSASHYFVKEVEVGLEEFELPTGVILVDTPGLDDAVDYRSKITRDYIDRANAVLVCVKADVLTGPEIATIYSVFSNTRYNPEKVYIMATQLDTLNRPKKDWEKQKKEWLKLLKGKSAYRDELLAEKNLVPVSAYLFTLLKEYQGEEKFEDDIENEVGKAWELDSIMRKFRMRSIGERKSDKYNELLKFCNIDFLKKKIQKEIVQNYKSMLLEDITGSYELCKESIKKTTKEIKKEQEKFIETNKKSIEDIKKEQERYKRKYEEMKDDNRELEHLITDITKDTRYKKMELENELRKLKY